jgi:hypothetical protein
MHQQREEGRAVQPAKHDLLIWRYLLMSALIPRNLSDRRLFPPLPLEWPFMTIASPLSRDKAQEVSPDESITFITPRPIPWFGFA